MGAPPPRILLRRPRTVECFKSMEPFPSPAPGSASTDLGHSPNLPPPKHKMHLAFWQKPEGKMSLHIYDPLGLQPYMAIFYSCIAIYGYASISWYSKLCRLRPRSVAQARSRIVSPVDELAHATVSREAQRYLITENETRGRAALATSRIGTLRRMEPSAQNSTPC